jgi:V/A-type H+/Na+-transporting ATPase subunit I
MTIFGAEKMIKLRIFCAKSDNKKIIDELYNAKALDIITHKAIDNLDIGSPLKESSIISEALVKIRRDMYLLNIIPNHERIEENYDNDSFNKVIERIDKLDKDVVEYNDKIKDISGKLKLLKEKKNKLKSIISLGVDLDLLKESRYLSFFLGTVNDVKLLKENLEKIFSKNYELFTSKYQDKDFIALFVNKNLEAKLIELIRMNNFSEMKISDIELNDNSLSLIEKEIKNYSEKKEKFQNELDLIKKENKKDFIAIEHNLSVLSKKSEAPLFFAETKNLTIITGWIPERKKNKVLRNIYEIAENKVFIEQLSIHKDDEVPILLQNMESMKPYEFLLRMFSMPSYHEINPIFFMFITFPLFFGFMLGDIGYGVTTLFLFMYLKKKIPKASQLLTIMIYCSISSIIFGFFYGELYGFEIAYWSFIKPFGHWLDATFHLHYPFVHRGAETALDLIKYTIVMGAIHVNLGLIFGFMNVYRNHGLKHAILEKGAWFVLQLGVVIIALSAMNIIPLTVWDGLIVILIAAIMLFMGEGIQGLVELPSIFVHISSYMRLMAIGLASVSLAVVINQQVTPLMQGNIFMIIAGILIFVVGHMINIALGIIGPFLHSLRLHYVEYFTKFYKGGGREFKPFGLEED